MARELVITVKVDNSQAKPALEQTEKGIKGVTDEAQKNDEVLNQIGVTAKNVALGLASIFTVDKVIAFAREITQFASDMDDASAKTGIGVEQLQALNYAAVGAGVSVDQITTAIVQLSKRLIGGEDSAVQAVEALGLSVKDLIQLDPADAFLTIAERVAAIDNPMKQAALSMALFGRSGADLLPAMKEDLRGLMEQARSTGSVMDKDLIAKADAFDDAWTRGEITMKAWGARLFELIGTIESFTSPMQGAVESFQEFRGVMAGLSEDMERLVDRMSRNAVGSRAFVREVDDLAMSTYGLEKAQRDLDEQERKNTRTRQEHTREVEKAEQAHRSFINWVGEREIEAFKANEEAIKANQLAQEEWHVEVSEMFLENEVAMNTWVDQLQENFDKAEEASEEWYRAVHDDMARNEHDMIAHKTTLGESWRELGDNIGQQVTGLMDLIGQQLGGRFERVVGGMASAWRDGQQLLKGIGAIMQGDFSGLIDTMMAGIRLVANAWNALKGLFSDETEHANDTRDEFLNRWFGGEGHHLAQVLTELGAGEGGGDLYKAFIGASTVKDFNDAKSAVERFLHDNNYPGFLTGGIVPGGLGEARIIKAHGGEGVLSSVGMEALNRLNAGQGPGSDMRGVERRLDRLTADMALDRQNRYAELKAAMQIARGQRLAQV